MLMWLWIGGFDICFFLPYLRSQEYTDIVLALTRELVCFQSYKVWILKTITETWNLFHQKFLALWDEHKDGPGEAYLPEIYNNTELQQLVKQKYMKELFEDTLGFGAAKMIRWLVNSFFLILVLMHVLSLSSSVFFFLQI